MPTAALARFIAQADPSQIPPKALDWARQAILDGLGVALGGSREPASAIITRYVQERGGKREAGVLGAGFRAPLPLASLANGTLAHALDFDDFTPAWMAHVTVALLPALLAAGEYAHISGKESLAAYVLGYEVEGRVGLATGPQHYEVGWHSTSTLGALGAAAVAARTLGLDEAQVEMALGIASSMAGGLRQNFGSMTKPLHAGLAASNGINAALLARQGFSASAGILEKPFGFVPVMASGGATNLGALTEGLGERWLIEEYGLDFKPYPSCRETHRCLDAALALVARHRPLPDKVAEVVCRTSPMVPRIVIHHSPTTALEAKFSMEFCMAVSILEGKAGLDQFIDEKVADPRVRALMKKVRFVHPPGPEGLAGLEAPEAVTLRLEDGTEHTQEVLHPWGSPQNPFSWEELVAKYRSCASLALSPEAVERSLEMVSRLESLPDLAELARVVCLL